jgi:hypothetical protein
VDSEACEKGDRRTPFGSVLCDTIVRREGKWQAVASQTTFLPDKLAGDTDWIQFEGEVICWPVLGGLGNVDDNLLDDPSGAYRAMSLRCYDLQAGRWSIWWVDARTMRLEPPVHGQFEDGIGTFYGEDTFAGKPIRVRFLWSDITPHSARWEQAFSGDGGANWEPNWVMIFKRQDLKK